MAARYLSSNCPARPTKGSPCKSSFSPGPSPTNRILAFGLPTPKTTWCRPSHSPAFPAGHTFFCQFFPTFSSVPLCFLSLLFLLVYHTGKRMRRPENLWWTVEIYSGQVYNKAGNPTKNYFIIGVASAMKVMVETSAHHVHVSPADLETLFGAGATLTNKKDLSQPGQFACAEKVTVVGPQG